MGEAGLANFEARMWDMSFVYDGIMGFKVFQKICVELLR